RRRMCAWSRSQIRSRRCRPVACSRRGGWVTRSTSSDITPSSSTTSARCRTRLCLRARTKRCARATSRGAASMTFAMSSSATMFDELIEPPRPPLFERWFAPDVETGETFLRARWIWLRSLGGIFFSAFLALWFQIDGLIGPRGILPAGRYLTAVREALGLRGYWLAPSLLWFSSSTAMLHAIVIAGLIASVALMLNLWPRLSIAIAGVTFLSFVAAAQDFSGYQSDGMLLEAALLSFFFAPRGVRPRLGESQPPSRASLFMLRWEWFRIYFESGLVKLMSGETQWRDLT